MNLSDGLLTRCPVQQAARRNPVAIALRQGGRSTDYATLDAEVAQLAAQLSAQGVLPQQRLLLISDDKGLILRLLVAALRLGVCLIPVNPRAPRAELLRQWQCSVAHWLLDPDDVLSSDFTEVDGLNRLSVLPRDSNAAESDVADDLEGSTVVIDPQQPLAGVFTSGSSGPPKLALHSYANHVANAVASSKLIPLQSGDCWALTLPLYHIGGLAILFRCWLAGASVQLLTEGQTLVQLLHPTKEGEQAPSHLSAVVTQILRLQAQGIDLAGHGLRTLLLGGSQFPGSLLNWLERQPLRVWISYGLTEMSSQVMTGPVNIKGHLVHQLQNGELKIAPDGEILVRGPSLFLGYLRCDGKPNYCNPERPLDSDGWFHTRDRGQLDADGALRILGRVDNQFISGGENIQPEEIEAVICQFPGVAEAYVVPEDHPEYGQRPRAYISWHASPDSEGLRHWLRCQLSGFKVPATLCELPQDARVGLKVSRTRLLAKAREPGC